MRFRSMRISGLAAALAIVAVAGAAPSLAVPPRVTNSACTIFLAAPKAYPDPGAAVGGPLRAQCNPLTFDYSVELWRQAGAAGHAGDIRLTHTGWVTRPTPGHGTMFGIFPNSYTCPAKASKRSSHKFYYRARLRSVATGNKVVTTAWGTTATVTTKC